MVAFTPTNVVAKAPDTQGDVQASAKIDEEASGLSKDYRLAPGDRLTIVVYDQPQLSGQFIVDGGGGILLPLAGAVSLSGLTLAEAQKRIQDRFADGVLVQPAVSVRITEYRPIFVTGNVRKPEAIASSSANRSRPQSPRREAKGSPSSSISTAPCRTTSPPSSAYAQLEADHTIWSCARRASKPNAMDTKILSCRCWSA